MPTLEGLDRLTEGREEAEELMVSLLIDCSILMMPAVPQTLRRTRRSRQCEWASAPSAPPPATCVSRQAVPFQALTDIVIRQA